MAEGGGEERTTVSHKGTPSVFISYASQDAAVANTVVEALELSGIGCWIAPRDVTPGAFYADEIVHAIDAAKALVLILSHHAANSQHVVREVERAASKRHPVVALRLDQAPLPAGLEYFLNTSQWLDASAGDITRSMSKLIAALRVAIQAPVVTPEAAPRTRAPAPVSSAQSWKRTAIIMASVIGLAIAGLAIDRLWVSSRRVVPALPPSAAVPAPSPVPEAPTIPEKSVAVLPFVDMSEKKDQEYFSDGLSEELIDHLAHAGDLKVIARTSSFVFKGKNEDMRTIGQRLGVANLLEGSVRTSGKALRVSAQLIKVSDGSHLWSETYDRKMGDIFNIQDEIADAVVKALKVSLLEKTVPTDNAARNMEAYTLFLQGRSIYQRSYDEPTTETAISYLRHAVNIDPAFADAWAHLSFALNYQARNWSPGKFYARFAEARRAAVKAMSLDPLLGDAHRATAYVYTTDWNWENAFAEFKRGYELDPGNPGAARNLADLTFSLRMDDKEALRLYKKAVDLDPLYAWSYWNLATAEFEVGEYPEAETAAQKAIDLNLNQAFVELAMILMESGNPAVAVPKCAQVTVELDREGCLALVYYSLGRTADADSSLGRVEQLGAMNNPYTLAQIHAYRGEADQAFTWLDRAYQRHDDGLGLINRDRLMRNLRTDPRYKAFLVKLKLPE
ncbi:MAG TPA: TIR domain-containing protein [Steroidobacteraceae bacterium]|nr:TIR domain-containing protein [Steroidobacteraceae bacterium]